MEWPPRRPTAAAPPSRPVVGAVTDHERMNGTEWLLAARSQPAHGPLTGRSGNRPTGAGVLDSRNE